MSKLERIMSNLDEYSNPRKLNAKRMAVVGFTLGAGVSIHQLLTNQIKYSRLEEGLIVASALTFMDTGLFALIGYFNQRINCRYVFPLLDRILKIDEKYGRR